MAQYTIETIGIVRTCFPEKFGIPRQAALAPAAKGQLILEPPYNDPACIEGLDNSSHIWLSFIFHENIAQGWKPKVRPPRLGGNQKMGVFATRSPFRPNGIGLSVVALESIEQTHNGICLHLAGVDLVDGTPIVDIKPYVPYTDSVVTARNSFAEHTPQLSPVSFTKNAQDFLSQHSDTNLQDLITQVLQQNPQPAYHTVDPQREYKMALFNLTITWRLVNGEGKNVNEVLDISS